MALTINYDTKIIEVPKADLVLISGTLYELDTNQFRKDVMSVLDNETHVWMPNAFTHNTEVTVGGTTIARTLEFINGYSVEFEDGAYSVRLTGSNNNLFDVENGILVQNQVQVIATNSAGLISLPAVEYADFGGSVTVDILNGEAGTGYPIGTKRRPVNNIPDARVITDRRGFKVISVIGDITLDTGDDITDHTMIGQNSNHTTITVNAGAVTDGAEFRECVLTGVLDGGAIVRDAIVDDISFFNGIIFRCMINPGTITLGGGVVGHLLDCHSGVPGTSSPTINMGGSGQALAIRGYNGGIELTNKTGPDLVSIDLVSGQVKLDSTAITGVTAGTLVCRGVGKVVDSISGAQLATGTISFNGSTVLNETVNTIGIQDAIDDSVVESAGSITRQQAESIMLAALAGVTEDDMTTFKDPSGTSTRISGTVSANDRDSVTVTPSS